MKEGETRIQKFLGSWLIALSILAIGSTGLLFASAADSPKAEDTSGYPLDVINIQNKGYKQDRQGQATLNCRRESSIISLAACASFVRLFQALRWWG